jgi:hypothetical protein
LKVKSKLLLLLALLTISDLALAENGCPDGMTPFQNVGDPAPKCYPIQDSQSSLPAQPQGHWETRWGAIATDGQSAAVGTVVGARNKRQAISVAMKQCRAKGGKSCKAILSYYNQCAVIVSGDKQHSAQSAATIDEASQIGMNVCNPIDTNCRVYYAECSPPVWVQ